MAARTKNSNGVPQRSSSAERQRRRAGAAREPDYAVREFRARRGVLLLEVVIALTIMVAAIALMGGQLSAGLRMTERSEELTRANALADRLLALLELDLELQSQVLLDEQRDGDFGEQHPGWTWQLLIEPQLDFDNRYADVAEEMDEEFDAQVFEVTIQIYRQPAPDGYEENMDSEDAKLVREIHLLKTPPIRVSLTDDFGVSEEQLAPFMEFMPDFDWENANPQELVALLPSDPEALMEMLPMILPLIQMFGGQALQQGGEGGVTPEMVQQLLQQAGLDASGGLDGGGANGGLDGLEPGAADALQQLLNLRDQGGGGAAQNGGLGAFGGRGGGGRGGFDAGGNGRGGAGGDGRRDAGAGRRGGVPNESGVDQASGAESGRSRYTIEDLIRLRDEGRLGGG